MYKDREPRKAVQDAFGSELTESQWEILSTQLYVDKLSRGEMDPVGVADVIRQWETFWHAGPDVLGPMRREKGGEATSVLRQKALSRIVAEEAAKKSEVAAFRSEHLAGRLLSLEKVERWVKHQAKKDGTFTRFLQIAIPEDFPVKFDPDGCMRLTNPITRLEWGRYAVKTKILKYGPHISVSTGGVLDELRDLSEQLADENCWLPADATLFVLTGTIPHVNPVWSASQVKKNSALSRITLIIDPTISPRELMDVYRRCRKRMLRGRYRAMSIKHIELALFWCSRPQRETINGSRLKWNKSHPKWRYKASNTFKRDCEAARKRLLRPVKMDKD